MVVSHDLDSPILMGLLSWADQHLACWISLHSWLERYDGASFITCDGFVRCILCCQTRGPMQTRMRGLVRKDFFFYLGQRIKVFMVRIWIRVGTRRVEMEESCGQKTCAGMAAPGLRQQVDAIMPEKQGASFIWVQIRDWEKPILVLNSHFSSSSMVPIHDITYFCV